MSTAIKQQLARLGVFETVYPDWDTMVDSVVLQFRQQQRPWRKIYADLIRDDWVDLKFYINQQGNLTVAQVRLGPYTAGERLTLARYDWRPDIPGVVVRNIRLHLSLHALQRFEQRIQRRFEVDRDGYELLRYSGQIYGLASEQPDQRCWVPFHDGLACMQYDDQLPDTAWCWLQPHSGQWHAVSQCEPMHYTVITFLGAQDMSSEQFFDWWKLTEKQKDIRQRYLKFCEQHNELPLCAV